MQNLASAEAGIRIRCGNNTDRGKVIKIVGEFFQKLKDLSRRGFYIEGQKSLEILILLLGETPRTPFASGGVN
jgi:hypothetical protein